jgi:hypothetical protein
MRRIAELIGEDIKDVEFAWLIGMPLVRSLGRDLWEVRSSLPHGRIARVNLLRGARLHGSAARLYEKDTEDAETGHRCGVEEVEMSRSMSVKKKNMGSTFDSWLREEGLDEEVSATAIKRVVSRQVADAMRENTSPGPRWPGVCILAAPRSTACSILTTKR